MTEIRTAQYYEPRLTEEAQIAAAEHLESAGLGVLAGVMVRHTMIDTETGREYSVDLTTTESLVVCPHLSAMSPNLLQSIIKYGEEQYKQAHPEA